MENVPRLSARFPRRQHLTRALHHAWGRLALAQAYALDPIRAFVAARPRDAHKPDYADLAYLWRTVQRQRPRVVLEYGSGCSTLLLALALQRTGQPGRFVTLETDPVWTTQTTQALPVTVRYWCHVTTSPLVYAMVRDVEGFAYTARPTDLVPDLVYLDGPGFTQEHRHLRHLYALDVLALEPQLVPGCRVIIDGRQGQTNFLRQHFQRPWRYQRSRTMARQVFTLQEAPRETCI